MPEDDLNILKHKIDAATEKAEEPAFSHPKIEGANIAVQVIVEFMTPIAVGGLLGLWLDKHFSLSPLFTLIFVLIGFATGIMSVLRLSKKSDSDIQ